MNWHVCIVGINQEFLAENGLKSKGFEVYCPRGRKLVRHARQKTIKIFPVISRYLLVKFNAAEAGYSEPIRSTDGIIDILCNNWQPVPVPEDKIVELQQREEAGEFNYIVDLRPKKQRNWSKGFEILKNLLDINQPIEV